MSTIKVVYQVEPAEGHDLSDVGEKIAQEQSLGGYEFDFHRGSAAEQYRARPDPAERTNQLQIRYPVENVVPDGETRPAIPHLLNYVAGDVFGSRYVEHIKLLDVTLPADLVETFPGPRVGISGIEDRLDVGPRSDLLGMIIKPSLGLTAEQIGRLTEHAGLAGVDVVKEDEKLVDPAYCRFDDRLDAVVSALRAIQRERDRLPLYVLNVTERREAFARYVADNDVSDVRHAFVLMATPISIGFSQFGRLATDDRLEEPVYAHRTGHAAYTRTAHGIDMRVIEQLSRLAGADFAHCGTVVGSHAISREQLRRNRWELVSQADEWAGVNRVLPVISGGVNPTNIEQNRAAVREGDESVLYMIGSGIHAHARGAFEDRLPEIAAGIRANRQAIEAVRAGEDPTDFRVRQGDDAPYPDLAAWLDKHDAE